MSINDENSADSAEQTWPMFCVVTPVFNGADYIDETIASVLLQAGDFQISYHIQDGGSTDNTVARIQHWADLLESGTLPISNKGIRFTFAFGRDSGMYDAINRAFARALPSHPDVVMGWVNADDKLAPGAFSTISNIRRQFPEIRLLGGRVALLDHTGSIIGLGLPKTYSRPCMAAGLYDGRAMPFVMQEGTFWTATLWRDAGGMVDTRFRLAGDWDLWRRFARHADYVSVDSILGFHRRRPGQLSGDMDKYYAEVDKLLQVDRDADLPASATAAADRLKTTSSPTLLSEYEKVRAEYDLLQTDPDKFFKSPYAALVLRFNLARKEWEELTGVGIPPRPPEVVRSNAVSRTLKVNAGSGFAALEGPYPEWNLSFGIRWMKGLEGDGEIFLQQSGRYEIVLLCRSWTSGQTVSLSANGITIGQMRISPHGHDRDIELRAAAYLTSGRQVLGIAVEQPDASNASLLITGWYVEPLPTRGTREITPVEGQLAPIGAVSGPLTGGFRWPRISVIVPTRNQGRFIADTLESVLRQGYPNLELIVADGASTDETPEILRRYARHITHLISEPDTGQSNAINKGFRAASGEILTWLNSDDLLAKGALHAVAFAFQTTGADLVAGVCDVFDDANATTHRHLPCLRDGTLLPLEDLLDLENCWMRGKFFHQPEVFFTRDIWERAGGEVDEDLYYSMDYDLWVRMARQGARISVIGRTVAHYRMHAAQKTATPEAYRPELLAHSAKLRAEVGLPVQPAPASLKSRLRIVMFNDYGFKYGAGIAHRRLAEALVMAGQDVVVLAYADFDRGSVEPRLNAAQVAAAIIAEQPDLVILGNLHAISADFDLFTPLIEQNIATVFYAHDNWLFTGRCGYPKDCKRYLTGCNAECPTAAQYPSLLPEQIAPAYAQRRSVLALAAQSGKRFAIFTNSPYLKSTIEDVLSEQSVPPVHFVPLGIDTRTFSHGKRSEARALLDLPTDRFVVLTSATNIGDPRKGLPLLIEALRLLPDRDQILLLIIGFGKVPDSMPCEVRFSGYLDRAEGVALHCQAADLFVGPSLEEAFGQTFIEAAACGVPAVGFNIDGIADAVIDGVTGLLVNEKTPESLSASIQRLRTDNGLRRQLGAQAVLFVRNRFSCEASAAQLLSTLVEETALDLGLTPNVSLAVGSPDAGKVRYLTGQTPYSDAASTSLDWMPLLNLRTETGGESSGLPARFWWGTGPASRLALRVPTSGDYRIRLRCRCHLPNQRLRVSANRGPILDVPVLSSRFNFTQDLEFDLSLIGGLNRIDIGFAVSQREENGTADLALLIESINVMSTLTDLANAPDDGATELIEGFSPSEGPYPEHKLPTAFNWAIGRRARFRLFSGLDAQRVVELRLRNFHQNQQLTVFVGDNQVLVRTLPSADLSHLVRLRFEAAMTAGFNPIHIEATQCSEADASGRQLAYVFEGLSFHPAGELDVPPDHDAIRWDMSEGLDGEEGPLPELGLNSRFRWLTSRRVKLVIDRVSDGLVRLRIRFRAPQPGQMATVQLPDGTQTRLNFGAASFADNGETTFDAVMKCGSNPLWFTFEHVLAPEGAARTLVLLVESIEFLDPSEAPGLPIPQAAIPPSVSAAVPEQTQTEDGFLQYAEGFGAKEGPYPDMGLDGTFHWAVGPKSVIRLYSRFDGERMLAIRLRNFHPDQKLVVKLGGSIVAEAALGCTFVTPQSVKFRTMLVIGWQDLELWPSLASETGTETRALSVLVEGIGLSEIAPLPERVFKLSGGPFVDGAWQPVTGFRDLESPVPRLGLNQPFRWCLGGKAQFRVFSDKPGMRTVRFTLRNFHGGQELRLETASAEPIADFKLPGQNLDVSETRTAAVELHEGWNELSLVASRWSDHDQPSEQLSFIFEAVELLVEHEMA